MAHKESKITHWFKETFNGPSDYRAWSKDQEKRYNVASTLSGLFFTATLILAEFAIAPLFLIPAIGFLAEGFRQKKLYGIKKKTVPNY